MRFQLLQNSKNFTFEFQNLEKSAGLGKGEVPCWSSIIARLSSLKKKRLHAD